MNTYLMNRIKMLREASEASEASGHIQKHKRLIYQSRDHLETVDIPREIESLTTAMTTSRLFGFRSGVDKSKAINIIRESLPEAYRGNEKLMELLNGFLIKIYEKRSSGKKISKEVMEAYLQGLGGILGPEDLDHFLTTVMKEAPCLLINDEIESLAIQLYIQESNQDLGLIGHLNREEKRYVEGERREGLDMTKTMILSTEEVIKKRGSIEKNADSINSGAFPKKEEKIFTTMARSPEEEASEDEMYDQVIVIAKMIAQAVKEPQSSSFENIHQAFVKLDLLMDEPTNDEWSLDELIDGLNPPLSIIKEYTELCLQQQLETRFIQNGLLLGKTDAYIDTGHEGKKFHQLKNPVTRELEAFNVIPILCKKIKDGNEYIEESLLGNILIAAEENSSEYPVMHIEWRGSQKQAAWISDAQRAPGFDSFFAHEEEILDTILKAIEIAQTKSKKPINVMISGHSLGGGLAQTTLNSLQRALCRGIEEGGTALSTEYDGAVKTNIIKSNYTTDELLARHQSSINQRVIPASSVASIHAITFNSAGVLQAVADSSNDCSRFLKEKAGISSHLHAHQNHMDIVQATGEATVLTRISDNLAAVELFYNEDYEGIKNTGIALGTHRVNAYTPQGTFTSPTKPVVHTIYQQGVNDAHLKEHLDYKYPFLQSTGDSARTILMKLGAHDVLRNYEHLKNKYPLSSSPTTVIEVPEAESHPSASNQASSPTVDPENADNQGGGGKKP